MYLNKFMKLAILISVIYVAVTFGLKNQLASLLGDQTILLWVSVVLTAFNISILLICSFQKIGVVLNFAILIFLQLAIFCQLHIQIYGFLSTAHYACTSQPAMSDWIRFTGDHVLRAIDLPDIMEAYDIRLQEITPQGMLPGIPLFVMKAMTGIFILIGLFKLIGNLAGGTSSGPMAERKKAKGKWMHVSVLVLAATILAISGYLGNWSPNQWMLWPLGNIAYTLDFGDALQTFNWHILSLKADTVMATAGLLFRVVIGLYAMVLLNSLLSRFLKRGGKSVGELALICASYEYPTKERLIAIKELEQFGMFAESAIPQLVKVLAGTNSVIRSAASQALHEIDPQWHSREGVREVIPSLMKMLTIGDKGSQIAAAQSLGEFGPAAAEAVPHLVKVLTDSDVLNAAAESLGKMGHAAIPDLVKVLVNEDEEVRRAAVQALERIDPQWPESEAASEEITRFVKDLEDGSSGVRSSAVQALGEIGPAAVPHLAKLLADSDVRSLAIKALGEIGPAAEEAAVPHLIKLLASPESDVRASVRETLEKIDPLWQESKHAQNTISYFLRTLADSNMNARDAATEALEKIEPKWRESESTRKIIPHFMKALADNDISSGYKEPAEGLVRIGQPAIYPLVKSLVDGNRDIFKISARALKKINPRWPRSEGANQAVPYLAEALGNSQWYVRNTAAQVLGQIGPGATKAFPQLVRALADGNKTVRASVKESMDKIALHKKIAEEEARKAAEPVVHEKIPQKEHTESERQKIARFVGELASNDPDIRRAAARTLEKIDPHWQYCDMTREQIPDLVNSLSGHDFGPASNTAVDALLTIGPGAIQYLVEALTDSRKDMVKAVRQLLKEIDPKWPRTPGARDAVPHLAKAMGDSQWYVRNAAAEVLGKIGPGAIKAVPHLVKSLADGNKTVRTTVKEAMDKIILK